MHILMLATGGTIASQSSQEGIRLAQKPLPLCHRYREEVDPAVEFTLRTPYQILSENLDPAGGKLCWTAIDRRFIWI